MAMASKPLGPTTNGEAEAARAMALGSSRPAPGGSATGILPDPPPPGARCGRLKVLLVSHWFPPLNMIGAVRVGKFAKHLHEAGHDVRVIAGRVSGDHSLALEIPEHRVAYVEGHRPGEAFRALIRLARRWRGRSGGGLAAEAAAEAAHRPPTGLAAALTRHYRALMQIPDRRSGWIAPATAAGYRIVEDWRPDIVVASAPPNSSLIVARRIARVCGAPWVAEMRDLWVDNPYYEEPQWRRWIDLLLEHRVLRSAAGLVTVTRDWAATLRRRHRQPIACVFNGFVEADFPDDAAGPEPGDVVSIAYTGAIYPGFRDPTPLFQAVSMLGPARERVAIHFYGPAPEEVRPLAAAAGVEDRIVVHDRVSYRASLAVQAAADALLLLQWNDARDAGNIPAKFFEYLGAGRPILMLGYERGDLAGMIRERGAGVVANDPSLIAAQLREWIGQRRAGIPPIDPSARKGLTRTEQNRRLERFLAEILRGGHDGAAHAEPDGPGRERVV